MKENLPYWGVNCNHFFSPSGWTSCSDWNLWKLWNLPHFWSCHRNNSINLHQWDFKAKLILNILNVTIHRTRGLTHVSHIGFAIRLDGVTQSLKLHNGMHSLKVYFYTNDPSFSKHNVTLIYLDPRNPGTVWNYNLDQLQKACSTSHKSLINLCF